MTDLHWLEAHEAAELIATKQLTSLELTGALLDRIEKYDNGLNAFLTLRPDQALEEAKKADEAVQKKEKLGTLHGVPFALKDIIDAADWPTTAHSRLMADNIAKQDAEVTMRLKRAGGILLGKLSTHEFALGGPSFDLPWPPARNAWGGITFPEAPRAGPVLR